MLTSALSAGTVDEAVALEKDLRHRYDAVAVVQQRLKDCRQRLGRMLGSVMEQYDAPRLHPIQYPPRDLPGRYSLPVETIAACRE